MKKQIEMKKSQLGRSGDLADCSGRNAVNSRRVLLEALTAGGVVAVVSVPEKWFQPIVDATLLPAHAQTSEVSGTCTPPFAVNDAVTVANGGSNSINILANDPGSPPVAVASFGDSLAAVGSFPADGSTVGSFSAGGGTLDVTIDVPGNLFVTSNGTVGAGNVVVHYRAINDCGFSDGQVEISFGDIPAAVDDEYTADVGLNFIVSAGTGLLNNDTLGTPAATLTAWGGGDASASVNRNPGTSRPFAGGTLTVNSDGSFNLVNPTTPGIFTFDYIIDNGLDSSQATVEVSVDA